MLKPLFKYADFHGRANRTEYWLFGLFQVIVYLGIMGLSVALGASGSIGAAVGIGLLLFVIVALGCFIPNLAVLVRRLHDSNRSAWWLLLYLPGFINSFMTTGEMISRAQQLGSNPQALANLAESNAHLGMLAIISVICQLVMFVFLVWPGTRGPNRFGDDTHGGGIDLSVFDAPELPAEPAKPPHKPIFDFTSPEPAAAQPAPAPAPVVHQPVSVPARQAPVFGKRR
jgi:uncharacterized membrane protein YhaH (DUF805 family)